MLRVLPLVLTLGTLSGLAFVTLSTPKSLAQTSASDLQPWQGGGQTEADSSANDPFNSRSGTGSSSIFDLINRIQSIQGQSSSEFSRNQDKNFDTAVEEFQKKQQEVIETSPE
jgi:hypothetical protein